MQNSGQEKAKKSLMNSLENLNSKAYAIEELSNLSYRLLKKFIEPHPEPEPDGKDMNKDNSVADKQPDLIDLFNSTAETMDKSINIIEENLEQVLDMID